jgi:two-component system, NarL family, invasion response regulator UvrY
VGVSRIFLIDDHVIVRDGLRAMLEAAGHEVVGEAGDAAAAVGQVLRSEPDLVLLDLNLQNRSGLEILSNLQARGSAARVLVLTMSKQPRHVAEALRLGASGYILKGSSRDEMLQAVDAVLKGRRHLGPEAAELAAEALSAGSEQSALASLSPRERQIVAMVVRGHSSTAIGAELHLSPKTVDTYRSRLMDKLGVTDLPALVRLAIRTGLIDAHDE